MPLRRVCLLTMPYHGPPPTPIEHELRFEDHQFLVSKTDVHGVITYANSVFVSLSGYTEAELLGSPHSLVRHPDMPRAAFKDLWQTIAAGREWRGLVKNMAKDGSFYWVDAMVTPSLLGGSVVGYMSVRRLPDPSRTAAIIPTYRQMRSQEAR